MEIQYNRKEDYRTVILPKQSDLNGDTKPDATLSLNDSKDIETTVIFLPNIWSLMPNSIEYQKVVDAYKEYIENPPAEVDVKPVSQSSNAQASSQHVDKAPEPEPETTKHSDQLEKTNKQHELHLKALIIKIYILNISFFSFMIFFNFFKCNLSFNCFKFGFNLIRV